MLLVAVVVVMVAGVVWVTDVGSGPRVVGCALVDGDVADEDVSTTGLVLACPILAVTRSVD